MKTSINKSNLNRLQKLWNDLDEKSNWLTDLQDTIGEETMKLEDEIYDTIRNSGSQQRENELNEKLETANFIIDEIDDLRDYINAAINSLENITDLFEDAVK